MLRLNSNIPIDKKKHSLWNYYFLNCIIFIINIINRNGGVMQLLNIWEYLLNPNVQVKLIAALTQKWRRQVEKRKGRELVCLPYIKDTNWLKGIGINRKIYQFNLRTKMLTAAPYRLKNKWEEIFNVPIPRHMVYELVQKTTLDSTLRVCLFK
jgi:hypothetical protein